MKKVALMLFTAVSLSLSSSSQAEPFPRPTLVNLGAEYVFAPPGFDNNDNVQIVVHGILPNTCYKAAPIQLRVDHSKRQVVVTAQAYQYSGTFCLQVVTPFTQTVDLGLLNAGSYQVLEVDAENKLVPRASLPVAWSTSAFPDSNLYAPVKTALVERDNGRNTLYLSGIFSANCLELDRVQILQRASRIVEVLPIARRKPNMECLHRAVPFETRVALPNVESGDNLIHIRSMNGNAVNLVEEL